MRPRHVAIVRWLLIALAVGGALYQAWLFRTFFVDDAGISFSYARTWAEGGGLVLQPGAERVEGYSNFLWVALLAAGAKLGADVFKLAHWLGVISLIATVIGSAELLGRLRGKRSPLDAMAAAIAALLTPVPYWAMSGLEGGLYTALVVWMCVALCDELETPQRFPWSATAAAALSLTRPDGVLFVGVAIAARVLFVGRARIALHVLLAALPVALHHLWRHHYYGYWFPNTFYVKAPAPTHLLDRFLRGSKGWVYIEKTFEQYKLMGVIGLAALAPVLAPALAIDRAARRRLVPIGALTAVAFFAVYAQGDWMSEGRFLVPAFPLLACLACDAVEQLAVRFQTRGLRVAIGVLVGGLVLATIVPAAVKSTKNRRNNYPVPVQGVAQRAYAVGELMKSLGLPKASLLDGDLGGTSYYGALFGLRMVDLGALADITIARYQHDLAALREYLLYEQRPTFMRLGGFWARNGLHLLPEMREDYVAIQHYGKHFLGMWMRRDVVTVDGIDTRKPIGSLPASGLDLIGSELTETHATLYVLVREPKWPLPTVSSAEKSVKLSVLGTLYPPSEWQRGEIIRFVVDRPPGAVQLCDAERCLPIADGKNGAQPLPPETPPVVDAAAATQAGLSHLARGEYDEAFNRLRAAIAADPNRVEARRAMEQIRTKRHEMAPVRLLQPLGEARRGFYLSPSPETMTTLVRLALAAGRPEVAARAHRATTIEPDAKDGAALLADALAGRSRVVRRDNQHLSQTFEARSPSAAPDFIGWTATGDAFASGPRRTHHSSDVLSPRADKIFDPFLHIDGAYWALPMQILLDALSSAGSTLPVMDSKDWTLSQLTYVLFTPAVWWLRDVVGVEGEYFIDSGMLGDLSTGSLRSRPLDRVDRVCFSVGGGQTGVGVRVLIPNQTTVVLSGTREEILRRACAEVGGVAGAVLEIFDESVNAYGHVIFDDLECYRDGASVPCVTTPSPSSAK